MVLFTDRMITLSLCCNNADQFLSLFCMDSLFQIEYFFDLLPPSETVPYYLRKPLVAPCCSNRSSCVKSSKNRKSGQSLFRRSFRVTSWTELVYESYWRWWAKNSLFLCILDAKKNIKRKHLEWIKKNPSRYLKICLGVIFKLVLTSLINLTGARQQ